MVGLDTFSNLSQPLFKIIDICLPRGSLVSHCKWLIMDDELKGDSE